MSDFPIPEGANVSTLSFSFDVCGISERGIVDPLEVALLVEQARCFRMLMGAEWKADIKRAPDRAEVSVSVPYADWVRCCKAAGKE